MKKAPANATTQSEEREKALHEALKQINSKIGPGTAAIYGEEPQDAIEVVSSGSLALDIALGRGGIPRGRIIEIFGQESSGKTLFTLETISEFQKLGCTAAFIDAEHAFDPEWASKIGVDVDKLVFSQPDSGEDAFNVLELFIASGAVDLVIVDSVSALVPQKELDGDIEDNQMGLQARMMSKGLRKVTGLAKKNNVTVVFINQIREKIGVMFGSPETTSGGKALKFYASVRMKISRISTIKEKNEAIGARTRVQVVKNKVAAPFKQAEFDILYDVPGSEGFSKESDIRDLGVELGLIQKAGAYFRYGDEVIGQGGEKARIWLKENPEVAKEIENKIRDVYFPAIPTTGDTEAEKTKES